MKRRWYFVGALCALAHCTQRTTQPAATTHAQRTVDAATMTAHSAPTSVVSGQRVDPTIWDSRCVAHRQCPGVPAIARCAPNAEAPEFSQVWNDHLALIGRRVTVRGAIVSTGGCTEMGCEDRQCCNGCVAQVVLAPDARGGGARSVFYFTETESNAGPFTCHGDDSAVCCNFIADGRTLFATGTLTGANGRYYLRDAEFCEP